MESSKKFAEELENQNINVLNLSVLIPNLMRLPTAEEIKLI